MWLLNGKDSDIALMEDGVALNYKQIKESLIELENILSGELFYQLLFKRNIASCLLYFALLKIKSNFIISGKEFDCSRSKNQIEPNIILSTEPISGLYLNSKIKLSISRVKGEIYLYKNNFKSNFSNKGKNQNYILLNTSGSTGAPKYVKLIEPNLQSNTKAIAGYLKLSPHDKSITDLPLSYTYGLSVLNTHMYTGGSVYLSEASLFQKNYYEIQDFFNPTFFSGVPSSYEICRSLKFKPLLAKSLRNYTQAGGKLKIETQELLLKLAKSRSSKLFIMYGQTEATARISYLDLTLNSHKIGSVGMPIEDTEIQIRNQNNKNIGEIYIKGPGVFSGYAYVPEDLFLPNETIQWLRTGDLGYLDNDGYLYVTGRLKRISKIDGVRLDLDSIENELNRSSKNIIVVGDDKYLYIVSSGMIPDLKQIYKIINKTKVKTIQLEQIPSTNSGKPDYSKVIKLARQALSCD